MSISGKIRFRGLRAALRRYENTKGSSAEDRNHRWEVKTGGYDCWWEVYYGGVPVAQCIAGRMENVQLAAGDFEELERIVSEEYPDMKRKVS